MPASLTFRLRRGYRFAMTLAGLAFITAAHAQTHYEIWPEADTWVRLTSQAQLLFTFDSKRDPAGDKTAGEGAAYLDFRVNNSIAIRGGMEYVRNIADDPGARDTIEHRYNLDFNYRWDAGEHGKLTDRSRVDFRDIDGTYSYRLRNRLEYEYEWKVGRIGLDPFANFELFYDSRYDSAVTRARLKVGATAIFSRNFETMVYLGAQHDTQPRSKDLVALGITLIARF
jgi:Protein of unknown function (DUF2490)